jgi:hypothetical protein
MGSDNLFEITSQMFDERVNHWHVKKRSNLHDVHGINIITIVYMRINNMRCIEIVFKPETNLIDWVSAARHSVMKICLNHSNTVAITCSFKLSIIACLPFTDNFSFSGRSSLKIGASAG